MGRRQSFADVNPEQGILAQGDVELEKLRLVEMQQRPPKHPRWHLLGHASAHLQAARIYAAVASRPGPCKREESMKPKINLSPPLCCNKPLFIDSEVVALKTENKRRQRKYAFSPGDTYLSLLSDGGRKTQMLFPFAHNLTVSIQREESREHITANRRDPERERIRFSLLNI